MTLTLEQQKANRKLWVDALRSGEYAQGQGRLRSDDRFCCLGVLADISGCVWSGDGRANDSRLVAPPRAREFVGLRDAEGFWGSEALAYLNDQGATFAEIADIIESEPGGLFVEDERP